MVVDPSLPSPRRRADQPPEARVEEAIAAALTAIDGAPISSTPGPARRAGWVVRAISEHGRGAG